REFRRSQGLRDRLLPHAHALLTQCAQSALCHRFHTPRERLCRWFLTVHDRAGSDVFRATQEFISGMLGTRRATVTEVAHDLQEQGLIDYRRGRVHVRDRPRIEQLVCRCYFVIKREMDSLKAGRDGEEASCQRPERIS
ncbi:MAG TPA: helix-turn-helix domain-containing protein, partial [Pyrinomonadaceae bacterium]|nr:helix-turn-helix domain-containing protein [Pyrinomonadaceae bacterium]